MSDAVLRRKRRAAGLCLDCGRPTAGRQLCEKHHARKMAYQFNMRRDWVRRRVCSECGKPTGGHYRCPRHSTQHNAAQMKTRAKWLMQGRCRHCGRSLEALGTEYGLTSCPVCQDGWDEQRRNVRNRSR